MSSIPLAASPLGQKSAYIDVYDKSLLFPILRKAKREELGIISPLPFKGYDLWTAFEISWLNPKGKPVVVVADIILPCETPCIIESKSFKLYLNSFNNTHFESEESVRSLMAKDLSEAVDGDVKIIFYRPHDPHVNQIGHFKGECLDDLEVSCTDYTVNPSLIKTRPGKVQNETVFTHLLKSNCLVTGQPDWGSVAITYSGVGIDKKSLLQYLVSFRNHNEFHEQCVERIFMDIMNKCSPDELSVYARYTRRGGLDINPIRFTKLEDVPVNLRLFRQ